MVKKKSQAYKIIYLQMRYRKKNKKKFTTIPTFWLLFASIE
jgi:hypothetical protein